MNRILALILIVSALGPLIRFRNHKLFYFFFFYAILDPVVLIIAKIIHSSKLWQETYLIGNVILLLSLSDLSWKNKIGLLFLIFILFTINPVDIIKIITTIVIMVFIMAYFINVVINELNKEGYLLLYPVLLSLIYLIAVINGYLLHFNIYFAVITHSYKLIVFICLHLLITYFGPERKIKIYETTLAIDLPDLKELYSKLSLTEQKILTLLVKGKSNSEIAKECYQSKRTVESHLYHIKEKLEFNSVRDLRNFANEVRQKDLVNR